MKAAFNDAERGPLQPESDDCCETIKWNGSRCERRPCTVLGILRRAALNMVREIQPNFRSDVSTGLRLDHIGCQPWILATALP